MIRKTAKVILKKLVLGICFYSTGNKYEGDWINDKMVGQGKFIIWIIGIYYFANGGKYEGEWKNEKADGRGENIGNW